MVQQKYRIDRLIGVGGMAAVYAATHRNGHRVAIKFLLERFSDDPDVCHLFSREAYVANQVGHPGAVPVLDDDIDESGCAFLIMPLLEGQTLRARWEQAGKRLALPEVGVLMLDVLDVLATAQSNGIVHRDIKPDNLFVTDMGSVRVLDFGIARRLDSGGTATSTGLMIGTPTFMPPEQALGERDAMGPHTDCWAVGATMFTLLSGEHVHKAEGTGAQLAAAATRQARSLAEVAPEVPSSITQFVDKALAFAPADRWSSAREMRRALVQALEEAFGGPLAPIEARVRAEIVAELSKIKARRIAEETLAADAMGPVPHRRRGAGRSGEYDQVLTGARVGMSTASTRKEGPAWRPTFAGIAVVVVVGAVFWSIYGLGAKHGGENAHHSAMDLPDGESLATRRGPAARPRDNPATSGEFGFHDGQLPSTEAVNAYNAGVQAWRDSSVDLAQEHFESATQLAPAFAAAHLRYALVAFWTDASTREHYQLAVRHRRDLNPADRELLDAYEPAMRNPPSLRDAERRLAALAEKHPDDLLILNLLAYTRVRLGDQQGALETIEPAIELDSTLANSWRVKGLALSFQDRKDDAELAFQRCVEVAPSSTACLIKLSNLATNEGNCELAMMYARKLTAVARNSATALHLARATYATTGSIESARAILQQSWTQLSGAQRQRAQFERETSLCLLGGDFVCARSKLREWENAVADSPDERSHFDPAQTRMLLDLETGHHESAAATARAYLNARAAWEPEVFYDFGITARGIQHLAGSKTRDDYARDRDAWLAKTTSQESLVLAKGIRWILAYADPVRDERDAREALTALPEYLPLPEVFTRNISLDESIGRTYLLGGDLENAGKYLGRAARSCRALENPIEHMWALRAWGRVLELQGSVSVACEAYSKVIRRWPHESSLTARLARSRIQILKCNMPSFKK